MFEPFQKFVIPASRRFGVSKELKASQMCQLFRKVLAEIFPDIENLNDHISPASFHDTYMLVNVSGPGFAQEVMMKKDKIISVFNEKAGSKVLNNLRTQSKR
jgi:hypothetical protein